MKHCPFEVIIEEKKKATIDNIFDGLDVGNMFFWESNMYVKSGPLGAVRLSTGNYVAIEPNTTVYKCKTVTITYEVY